MTVGIHAEVRRVARTAIAVLLFCLPVAASAATLTWTGATNTDWFNASNWSPAQVPTSADDATIDVNAVVVVAGASTATFNSLTLGDAAGSTSPTLQVTGSLTTAGLLTVDANATFLQDTYGQLTLGQVVVASGGRITHTVNSSTRSFVVNLSVSGNFNLQPGAAITTDGRGYLGGPGGGNGRGPGGGGYNNYYGPGDGGGHGGTGGAGYGDAVGGTANDGVTNPADLGSGGGGYSGFSGGNGGGAVILNVGGTLTVGGTISANGANGTPNGSSYGSGGGAGGTVSLTAATLAGSGTVQANGGAAPSTSLGGGGGGGGRIAISVTSSDGSALNLQANPGLAGSSNGQNGGAGTVAVQAPSASAYNLAIGNLTTMPQATTPIPGASLTFAGVTLNDSIVAFDAGSAVQAASLIALGSSTVSANNLAFASNSSVEVRNGAVLKLSANSTSGAALVVRAGGTFQQTNTQQLSFVSATVEAGGVLTHAANVSGRQAVLYLNVSGDMNLQAGSAIFLDGLGYAGHPGGGVGYGPGGGAFSNYSGAGDGGGHGGTGGVGYAESAGGAVYDSATNPVDLGSAGGGYTNYPGGNGGGALILNIGGTLTLNGAVTANGVAGVPNGSSYSSGGGAGGTVNITANSITGTGSVQAKGGTDVPTSSGGGGGGGGRVALTGCNANLVNVAAAGGAATGSSGAGATGTSNIVVPGSCPSPPATPASIAFTAVGGESLTASWSPANLATGYLLQVSAVSDFSSGVIAVSTTGTSGSVAGLLAGTTYFARVQSSNSFGSSPFTSSISTATLPIIDDGDNLNVPAGYTYVMSGTHTYTTNISVNGTVQVGALTQGSSGFLVLSAPNIHIYPSGRIIADAAGYGSGSGPGAGTTIGGNGTGGGGGYGGQGGQGPNGSGGASYGSLLQPREIGSGGAPGVFSGSPVVPGGFGGGRVEFQAGTLIVDGLISANGGIGGDNNYYGKTSAGGSGGAVLINATQLQGAGTIAANGGTGVFSYGQVGSGGGGRIAATFGSSSFTGSVTASGVAGFQGGAAGTVVWGTTLRVDDGSVLGGSTTIPSGTYAFDSVVFNNGRVFFGSGSNLSATSLVVTGTGTLSASNATFSSGVDVRPNAYLVYDVGATGGSLTVESGATFQQANAQALAFSSVLVQSGGMLTHSANISARNALLNLNVTGDMTLSAGATILVDGLGYGGGTATLAQTGQAPGFGPGGGSAGGNGSGAGGGHGGAGGNGDATAVGGVGNDDTTNPSELGSGGAGSYSSAGSAGGGAAILKVGGTLNLNGTISANGQSTAPDSYYATGGGAGSGGTINITAAGLTGAGTARANGGNGSGYGGAAGGGGRIAVAVTGNDASALIFSANSGSAVGSGRSTMPLNGGAGTIAIQEPGAAGYSLIIGTSTLHPQAATQISGAAPSFVSVLLNNGIVAFDAGASANFTSLIAGGSVMMNVPSLTAGSFVLVGSMTLTAGSLTCGTNPLEVRAGGMLTLSASAVSNCNLIVRNGGVFRQANSFTLNLLSVEVDSGGQLTHAANATARSAQLNMNVSGNFNLQSGASIIADGLGYTGHGGSQVGAGSGGGGTGGSRNGGGGGHGGAGATSSDSSPGGAIYDSAFFPQDLGSQGGGSTLGGGIGGGAGGGAILLQVGGACTLDGLVSANGIAGTPETYYGTGGGGGSGGTINIGAATLAGAGTLRANGGGGTGYGGAAGGGGRIALAFGSKAGTLSSSAAGGTATAGNGVAGTVMDNSQLSGFSNATSTPTAGLTQLQEKLSATQSLSETLSAQSLDFTGGTSTGVSPGTFSVAKIQLVTLQTGSFAGDGFFRGNWALSFPSGDFLSGVWQGTAQLNTATRQMVVKGVIEGGVRGVLEGDLTESVPGSGNFDRMSVACSATQIGTQLGASSLYFTASASLPQTAQYPGTGLNLLQASLTGQTSGYLVGPLENTFTLVTVNSPGNPYNGEGFFFPTYSSTLGTGQGWAYANTSYSQVARLSGLYDQPLRSLFEGILVTVAPRSLLVTLERLDVGAPIQPILSVFTTHPHVATPGAVDSYSITIRNDGYAASSGNTVVAAFPEYADFVSASSGYVYYSIAHYLQNSFFSPEPFLRWDLAQIPPRSSITLYYQAKFRPASLSGPQAHSFLGGGDVELVSTSLVNQAFAAYPTGGTR